MWVRLGNTIKLKNTSFQNIKVENGTVSGSTVPGTTDHSKLINRDLPNQHPISAITGLEEQFIGVAKLYIGSGSMPDDYNIQIDPNGESGDFNTKVILSNTMTKEEVVSAINNAPKGTRFDVQSHLDLYDVNITFPEESVIYSSTGKKNISFGYSDESLNTDYYWQDSWYLSFGKFSKIYDLSVYFSDNATANVGVNFGEGCEVTNCYFSGYEPCSWSSNCTFVNCSFGYHIYSLSIGGSYIKCHFDYTNEWSDGIDCSAVSLIDCSSTQFKINPQNGSKLIAKVKALNPDMNIIDTEGNEVRGLYVTADDLGDIESALDSIIAIQNSLIGGDA